LIVAASVGIGYAPAGGFDWTVFALVFTALSTLVLALSTGALALSTWQDVRETTRLVDATVSLVEVSADEVELSRRAIEAEVKPLIVDWPADNRQVTVKPGSEEGAVRNCRSGSQRERDSADSGRDDALVRARSGDLADYVHRLGKRPRCRARRRDGGVVPL
jgi:hypothetical protein